MAESSPTFDVERFKQTIEERIVLDPSRQAFIDDTAITLKHLMNGTLRDANRFRRLILAGKGVGKSTLMKEIVHASRIASNHALLTVEISYACGRSGNERTVKLPTAYVFENLPLYARIHHAFHCRTDQFSDINTTMKELGIRMLVTIDELETVYGSVQNGKLVIDDLYALGDLDGGAIHCILSGSSSEISALAFCKLPEDRMTKYPNYESCRNLNHLKFNPRRIHPFCLEMESFVEVIRFMQVRFQQEPSVLSEEELQDMLVNTGGNVSHIENSIRSGNTSYAHSMSSKDYLYEDGIEKQILIALHERVSTLIAGGSSSPFDWMVAVQASYALASIPETVRDSALYDMGDRGIIRFNGESSIKEIGFANPLIYLEVDLHVRREKVVSVDEILALKCYSLDPAKSEKICLRLLARASSSWCKVTCPIIDDINLPDAEIPSIRLPNVPVIESALLNRLCKEGMSDRPTKKGRDALGADATLIEKTDTGYTIHRLRLELGRGRIQEDRLDAIFGFCTMRPASEELYNEAGFMPHRQIWYLASTHDFNPSDRATLDQHGIRLLDRQFLAANVWPKAVKELVGKPFV